MLESLNFIQSLMSRHRKILKWKSMLRVGHITNITIAAGLTGAETEGGNTS